MNGHWKGPSFSFEYSNRVNKPNNNRLKRKHKCTMSPAFRFYFLNIERSLATTMKTYTTSKNSGNPNRSSAVKKKRQQKRGPVSFQDASCRQNKEETSYRAHFVVFLLFFVCETSWSMRLFNSLPVMTSGTGRGHG